MFAPYCKHHASRILLSTRRIISLTPTEKGLVATFVCTCGTMGTWSPNEV
jgi:hypothetical protein